MTTLLASLGALAAGVASALVPFVNAELYAVAAAGAERATWAVVLVVAALAVGQTAGKTILFESARRGTGRAARARRGRHRHGRARRWSGRIQRLVASPRTGPPVVLAAASLGVPPLALTSIAAGACGQARRLFIPLCLVGRTARFLVLVTPVIHLLH